MDIPTIIRVARRKAGLSQRKLADRLKVAPSAVAQWETGKTLPELENRVELAKALQIPFSELMPEALSLTETDQTTRRTQILVQKFQALPEPVQEAILVQISAVEVALSPPKTPHNRSK